MKLNIEVLVLILAGSLANVCTAGRVCPTAIFLQKRSNAYKAVRSSIRQALSINYYGYHFHRRYQDLPDWWEYQRVATKLNRSTSTADYEHYLDAIKDIVVATVQFCDAITNKTDKSKEALDLINAFNVQVKNKDIKETRKVYGKLLCLRSLSTNITKRQSTPLDIFFDSLDGTRLNDFRTVFDYIGISAVLAFVVDDTGSMGPEISKVKELLQSFIKTERSYPYAYMLGTFNDPVSENKAPVLYKANNLNDLVHLRYAIKTLSASGGGDCPEYGMKGISDTIKEISDLIPNVEYANIIVLTDAPPKDKELKDSVIISARAARVSVHFFISHDHCGKSSEMSPYKDIANVTCGIVFDNIVDFDSFTRFADEAKDLINCSTAMSTPVSGKRSVISLPSCFYFTVSVFTQSFNILFIKFKSTITIKSPKASSSPVYIRTSGLFTSFNRSHPSTGTYSVCSFYAFDYFIHLNSSFDFVVEHYDKIDSNPVAGSHQRVFVSSTQLYKIQRNQTILQLISRNGAVLRSITLRHCGELLFGRVTIPNVPYRYRLRGYDYKGLVFFHTKKEVHTPVRPPTTSTYATSVPTTSTCPCHNNGECKIYYRYGRKLIRCICPPGYLGPLCQYEK